ncbi:MAG TPA: tetratricopeptide repeat protein [Anaeromyxobacteraceae bacterium]|nr:tetratricopeptide repeat protein [Anaeromyxobacteraceae bacterium]
MIAILVASLLFNAPDADLRRARARFEFGAYADCAGTLRQILAGSPELTEAQAVDVYRMLAISEYQLGDLAQARSAFVNLLSWNPDFTLDPFLVPPPIVELFEQVKRENEASLAPLRERRRAIAEQKRLADEAKRKLLLEEQARTGPPTKIVRVQERLYLFNWMPLGAGQFQNGERAKGTALAAGQVAAGLANLGTFLLHNQIADDRSRLCTSSEPNCSRPPFTDSDRRLLGRIESAKYVTAGLFWALYAYGVWDAHRHFVREVETEISPQPGGATLGLTLRF